MVLTQLLEFDIFLEALERSVAGELFEAGDADSCGDSLETPRRRLRRGERRPVKPGAPGPSLDGQCDRIGIPNPVTCWRWLRLDALRSARRRQPPDRWKSRPSVIVAAASQVLREVQRRLGLADRLAACLKDPRAPEKVVHRLAEICCRGRAAPARIHSQMAAQMQGGRPQPRRSR